LAALGALVRYRGIGVSGIVKSGHALAIVPDAVIGYPQT
jgi:hypothetical protein